MDQHIVLSVQINIKMMENKILFTTYEGYQRLRDEMLVFLKEEFSKIDGDVKIDEDNPKTSFEIYFSPKISDALVKRDVVSSKGLYGYYQDMITEWLKKANNIEIEYKHKFLEW